MRNDRELNQALLAGAEREQRLLAQELHDTLCQTLAGISLLAKLLHRRLERGGGIKPGETGKIVELLDEAIDHVRAPLRFADFPSDKNDLAASLGDLARIASKKINCSFKASGKLKIKNPQVARVLFRIAKEVIDHLIRDGNATKIAISLNPKTGLAVEVIGKSTDRSAASKRTLREIEFLRRYADAVGLKLSVESIPKGTFHLRCTIPRNSI